MYQARYRGDLRDLYQPSAGRILPIDQQTSPNVTQTNGSFVPQVLTEQERYMMRLRSSIEKQGQIYHEYANRVVIPKKLESIKKIEDQLERSKSHNQFVPAQY